MCRFMSETIQDRAIRPRPSWPTVLRCFGSPKNPVPFRNTVLGKHRFSVAAQPAPLVWNSLPLDLRTANSLPVFKNNLKTFLFRRAFK